MKYFLFFTFLLVGCTQAYSRDNSQRKNIEASSGCFVHIPSEYSKVRDSKIEKAFFSGGERTGSIAIKKGNFTAWVEDFEKLKSQYERAERWGENALYYRVDRRGSLPVAVASLFGPGFGVIVTGKDAADIDKFLSGCGK